LDRLDVCRLRGSLSTPPRFDALSHHKLYVECADAIAVKALG
jgi:hypothetical protein